MANRSSLIYCRIFRYTMIICHLCCVSTTSTIDTNRIATSNTHRIRSTERYPVSFPVSLVLSNKRWPTLPTKFIDYAPHSFVNILNVTKMNSTGITRVIVEQYLFDGIQPRTLKKLIIRESQIEIIMENSFQRLTRLKAIDLSYNRIETLHQNLFSSCKRLTHLVLTANKIKILNEHLFAQLHFLIYLSLSDNRLTILNSSELFKSTTALQYLYLERNYITSIFGNIFKKLASLVHLNLAYNLLNFNFVHTCDGKVAVQETYYWLVDVALISNGSVIDLRHNQITGIQSFEGFRRSCLHNRCKLITLLLDYNPISCGCNGFELISYFRGNFPQNVRDSVHIKLSNLTCQKRLVKQNRSENVLMSSVELDNIMCRLDECPNCPPMCECVLKRNNITTVSVRCDGRGLKSMPQEWPNTNDEASEMWLGNNKFEKINDNLPFPYMIRILSVPNNNISELPTDFTKYQGLKVLELHGNNFKMISVQDVKHIMSQNLSRLTLGNNPWNCSDCRILQLRTLLIKSSQMITDHENITCWKTGKLVSSIDPIICQHLPEFSSIVFLIVGSMLSITFLVAIVIKFVPKWTRQTLAPAKITLKLPVNKLLNDPVGLTISGALPELKYDAFISYSHEDENYVAKLVKILESSKDVYPYKLCLHSRDWTPGEFIIKQMAESVTQSRTSIVILSEAYFKSRWCYSEFRIALTQMLVRQNHRVIAIWLSDQNPDEWELDPDFRLYFSTCTYLRHDDSDFIYKLKAALRN